MYNDFCKWVLGVGIKVINIIVRGECGRMFNNIKCIFKLVIYWLKIIKRNIEDFILSVFKCFLLLFKIESV